MFWTDLFWELSNVLMYNYWDQLLTTVFAYNSRTKQLCINSLTLFNKHIPDHIVWVF